MANEKISAMPAASEVSNFDIFPAVQSGSNVKAQRQQILTAAPGEGIALVGAFNSTVSIDSFGGITIHCQAEGSPTLITMSGTGFNFLSSADAVFQSPTTVRLVNTVSSLEISVLTTMVFISYLDTSFNWNGTPADFQTAIQRLGAAVAGLLGGAIP